MKNFILFYFIIFLVACQTDAPQNENSSNKIPTKNQEKNISTKPTSSSKKEEQLLPLSNHQLLEKFALEIKKYAEEGNIQMISAHTDPLQKGIQTEDLKMSECQFVKENFNLKREKNDTDCEVLQQIKSWTYHGYEVLDTYSFVVEGTALFDDGSEQKFVFFVNQLSEICNYRCCRINMT